MDAKIFKFADPKYRNILYNLCFGINGNYAGFLPVHTGLKNAQTFSVSHAAVSDGQNPAKKQRKVVICI